MKPLGPPPRIYGMKITSNRIEAFFMPYILGGGHKGFI